MLAVALIAHAMMRLRRFPDVRGERLAALIAHAMMRLIWLVTKLSLYGRASFTHATLPQEHVGPYVVFVPFVVGLMARYGSKAIRGHDITEAREQVLLNESRILARLTFLKPLSAAIAAGPPALA